MTFSTRVRCRDARSVKGKGNTVALQATQGIVFLSDAPEMLFSSGRCKKKWLGSSDSEIVLTMRVPSSRDVTAWSQRTCVRTALC